MVLGAGVGCSSEPSLTVDVVTGVVPGAQFASVQVEVFDGSAVEGALVRRQSTDRDASFGDDYLHGVRVASFEHIGEGVRTVSVRLLTSDLRLVIQRRVTFTMSDNFALRVHITPNCVGVMCPSPGGSAGFSECLDGQCVDPRCNPPTDIEFCPAISFCNASSECTSPVACAEGVCAEGVCDLAPAEGERACSTDTFCDPSGTTGCTPLPTPADGGTGTDASMDGGVQPDASTDAGPRCGAICVDPENPCLFGFIDCSGDTPFCNATLERTGTPCGAGQVCGLRGACVDCVEGGPCQSNCRMGTLSCGSGIPSCTASDSATPVTPGTLCTTDCAGSSCAGVFVCSPDADCNACDDGASCIVGCDNGHISCAAGGVCVSDGTAAPEFTVCGPSNYCDGRRTCIDCAEGAPCMSYSHCAEGTQTGCTTAAPRCALNAVDTPGIACPEGICSGDGLCYEGMFALGVAANSTSNSRSTCAITESRHVACWGGNEAGELGWGHDYAPGLGVKVEVVGIDDAVEIGGSAQVYCVRRMSGEVWCWGSNICGALGDGTLERRNSPVRAILPGPAVDIDVGAGISCAVLADGRVFCWGGFGGGRCAVTPLPDLPISALYRTPTAITGITDAVQVAADQMAACVRHADGTISCFGLANQMRMGDGMTYGYYDYVYPPVDVVGVNDAIDVSMGQAMACVVHADGKVSCWGQGSSSVIGYFANDSYGSSSVPVPASLLTATDVVKTEVGATTICALRASGQALCWSAFDGLGMLGRGTQNPPSPRLPLPVINVDDFVELSNGGIHMCGRRASGLLTCWGTNTIGMGELGIGHAVPAYIASPVTVEAVAP